MKTADPIHPTTTHRSDVLIIGGGAAGLFCAALIGKQGRSVTVLERNDRVGKKILISGGGRCNFTNLGATPKNYLSTNPHFCKSALARFSPQDFIALIDKYQIPFHEKKLGQQFCDESSRRIVELLLAECEAGDVKIHCNTRITSVSRKTSFEVEAEGSHHESSALIIATGGLSFANLGATDFSYRIATQFEIPLTSRFPGLVPLTMSETDINLFRDLSGVSLPVRISFEKTSFCDDLLFTHRGLSGPAALQISSYWKPGQSLEIDLLPGCDATAWLTSLQKERQLLHSILSSKLPSRLAKAWSERHGIQTPLAQTSLKNLKTVGESLNRWTVFPAGTEGYPKAEVTVGGVDTRAISSKTMECRTVPGLYFIGEALDVTGHLGGYNFQWAWASAHAAAESFL